MGGHLLHHWNLPEKRVSRADFDRIIEVVVSKLRARFLPRRIEPLRFFSEKQDFGDLDVAFEVFHEEVDGEDYGVFGKEFRALFGNIPHHNGNCISFPVEGFQVDILMFNEDCFDIANVYYAFESGNFMGRIADAMGLSYGHRGLYLQVPLNYFAPGLPDHEYRDVLISRDPHIIFNYLGFDYLEHIAGFRNFDAMSQWVADSKYFNPKIFAFDALNSINRTRNRKRPVYAKFVEWCEQQPAREDIPSKEEVRERIIHDNVHVRMAIDVAHAQILKNLERRAKFNGNLVKELRNIEDGPALGRFIIDFKKKIGNMDAWLDSQSADQVKQAILNFEK